jgi:GNAT superfamily N-acetyltransferase
MADVTPEELALVTEFAEAGACIDLCEAVPAQFAAEFGIRVERIGSAVALMAEKFDIPLFNRVIGLGVKEPATETMLEDIAALYRPSGVKYMVQLCPSALPALLPEWLEARDVKLRDNWAKAYRRAEPVVSETSLRLEVIGTEWASAFVNIAGTAFGMPDIVLHMIATLIGRQGWRHYMTFDGDQPVGIGSLFVRGHVGWLGVGATLPSHRGRGSQGAIMARRISDAGELGCKWVVTETGEDKPESPNPSYHNMVRTGFKLAYLRPNYIYNPVR